MCKYPDKINFIVLPEASEANNFVQSLIESTVALQGRLLTEMVVDIPRFFPPPSLPWASIDLVQRVHPVVCTVVVDPHGLVQFWQAISQDIAYLCTERVSHEPQPRLSPDIGVCVLQVTHRSGQDGHNKVLGTIRNHGHILVHKHSQPHKLVSPSCNTRCTLS